MNVTELRDIARNLSIKGFSKLRKAELIIAIGDACYDEATAINDEINTRNLDTAFGPECGAKRMKPSIMGTPKRLATYFAQNGSERVSRLTARQVRRINKKIRKQFATV